jgi:outer membrane protein assembly factor BamB/predicted phosphodiesterase
VRAVLGAALVLCLLLVHAGCSRGPFRFAWLSDTHVGADGAAENLRRIVDDINSTAGIKFVIVSGDVTEMGSDGELRQAKDILDGLRRRYHIIPGNHDTKWSESGGTDFLRLWKRDRFAFERGGIRFLGLHQGPVMRMGDGHFAPQDVLWLDERLAKWRRSGTPLVFVTHYPLDESIANWFVVLDRLKALPTRAVLVGHGHRNRIMDFEGIPGIMGRSALATKDTPGGYTLVEIGSGKMTFSERLAGRETLPPWHSVDLEGGADEVRIEKGPLARPDFSINADFPAVRERWCYETGWTIAAAPSVAGERAFVGDASGTMRALRLGDGSVDWSYRTRGPVYSTAVCDGERIFFGSADGHVYALEAETGRLAWKVKTARPVVASPAVSHGVVYVGSSDGVFRALDAATGGIVWRYDGVGGFVETRPLIADGVVVFGAWDGVLYALDERSGKPVWTWRGDRPHRLYAPAACWPVGARGKVFIVAPDRKMTAIETATGREVWRTGDWAVRESIGMSEDGSRIYVRTTEDVIAAFQTTSAGPDPLWELDSGFGYDINSAMLVEKDGVVFYGTKNGLLIAIEGATGTLLWKHRLGVALLNTVCPLSGREVLVTDFDGRVTLVTSN